MTERLERVSAADLEIRGEGRTVAGICVPFDVEAEIRTPSGGYRESFQLGAFARSIRERGPQRVKFLALHGADKLPLGRATALREDPAGLYGEFKVSSTAAGDEALELIRDSALDGLSIGFQPVRDRWAAGRAAVTRLEVKLLEVSAVAFPAYRDALVSSVRSEDFHGPSISVEAARQRIAGICPTISNIEAHRRLDSLSTRGR